MTFDRDKKRQLDDEVQDDDGGVDFDKYYSIGDDGLQSVASDYIRDRFFTEDVEPPSYENEIPIGRDKQTGEVVWMKVNSGDRIGIFGRTGSGKTFLLKALISRLFLGGSKIVHLSDVKNDFIDLDHGDGIQKRHMNLLDNEKRQPIPVNLYMPKFMEDEYRPKPPQKDNFHRFAYDLSDLSESDWLGLLGVGDSQSKRDLALRLYEAIDDGKESFSELYKIIEDEDDFGKRTKRGIRSTLENLEKQHVVSNRYQKKPTDHIEDSVVSIALEHWDKFKRNALEKVELQIAITCRKILDDLRENKYDGPVTMVIDEAHTFCPSDGNSISRDDIVDVIDLGRAYDIPMIFATQRVSQLPREDVIDQMNKFFISKTLSKEDRKLLLDSANIYEHGDSQRNRWTRIFRNMDKYDKMFIDKQTGNYKVISNLSPLCSHK